MADKILIVDYEPKSLEQTSKLLQNAGYSIIKAKDGLAAVDVFNKEIPDAVVLAAMLPKMHGFEVCRTIKKSEQGKNTPIIITTGVYKGEKYKRQALTEYGADGFFEKPYNPQELLSHLNELLNKQTDSSSQEIQLDLDTDLESKLEDTLSGLMEIGSDSDVVTEDTNLEAKLEDTLAGLMNIDDGEKQEEQDSDNYFNPLELSSDQDDNEEAAPYREPDRKYQKEEIKAKDDSDSFNISDIDDRLEDTLSSMLSSDEEPSMKEDTDIDKRLQETLSGLEMPGLSDRDEYDEGPPSDATIEFDTLNAIRAKEQEEALTSSNNADNMFKEETIDKEPEDEIIKSDTKTDIIEKYGQYELIQKIATGGMAELFKARRINVEGFEKIVAIKRILPHLAEDKEFITMFIDEAKLAAQLTHQNIVQIYDLDKVNSSFYIAMEYVKGKNAKAMIQKLKKSTKKLPIELTLNIISKVCSALDYAHRRRDSQNKLLNIVHRDVSPQNILISYEGEVKLVDFGIAKAATKASQTQAGALKGKILYMSPEQAWGKKVDKRSDIYSIGIVLYELLTCKRLFSGSSEIDILEKVRKSVVRAPSELNPKVPEELDKIIFKTLSKDPKDRYQHASELQHEIENLLFSPKLKARKFSLSNMMKFLFKQEMQDEGEELEAEPLDYFTMQDEEIEEISKVNAQTAPVKDESPEETVELDTFKDLDSKAQPFIKTDKKEIIEAKQTIEEDWDGRQADLDTHKAQIHQYEETEEETPEEYAEEEDDEAPVIVRRKKPPIPLIIGGAAVIFIVLLLIIFVAGRRDKTSPDAQDRDPRFVIETEPVDKDDTAEILTPEEIRRKREEQERKEQIASLIEKINESLNSDQIALSRNYIEELRSIDPDNPSLTSLQATLTKRQSELEEEQRRQRERAQADEIRRQQEQIESQIAELMLSAETALSNRNYQEAQGLAQSILELDSTHERASEIFGQAGSEIQRLERERRQSQQIANLMAEANTFLENGDFSSAIQAVNNVLSIDSNHDGANDLLTRIEAEQRRAEREERRRLVEERILDAEADVPPRMVSSLNVNLAHLDRRIPTDFRQRMRELRAKLRNRIPVQLYISETGEVENVRFTMTRTDLDLLERFGYTTEIENALKEAEFSPAIKDGLRRKSILNMFITIVW